MRTDGQVQLHVRDAVASKLPQGMLVSLPPTLVRPQRKHMHHCGSSGEGPQGASRVHAWVENAAAWWQLSFFQFLVLVF